jgi:hypothetical protein
MGAEGKLTCGGTHVVKSLQTRLDKAIELSKLV